MSATQRTRSSAGRFRTELHGLRAVAIAMVVCYHVWFGRVSGGIDIFLLISSFLLMQTMVGRIDRGGGLDLPGYWAKAFRRLLPPAVLTILATGVMTFLVLPPWRWLVVLEDARACLLYHENWRLAFSAADYYADKSTISPLQHFWSLSIQGQIFLLWPALIGLCWWAAGRRAGRTRMGLWMVFTTIFCCSLIWSIYQSADFQTFAYFSSWTRLWEFAGGALLALGLPGIERFAGLGDEGLGGPCPPILRAAASWLGLLGVLSCGLVVDVQGLFPGAIALWPTLCACLVIVAGHSGTRWGADRLLSTRLLQWLGDISYGLYLVHWPVLVAVAYLTESDELPPGPGLGVLVVSLAGAWALTRFVDEPVRYSRWAQASRLRSLGIILLALAVGLAGVLGAGWALDRQIARVAGESDAPGARVLLDGSEVPEGVIVPHLSYLPIDWFGLDEECTGELVHDDETVGQTCWMNSSARPLVIGVGNSRLEQYLAAFVPLAEQRGWGLASYTLGGCPHGLIPAPREDQGDEEDTGMVIIHPLGQGAEYDYLLECWEWNQFVHQHILEVRPDYVVVESTFVTPAGEEILMPGVTEAITAYRQAGIDVIAIRDMPRLPGDPLNCLTRQGEGCAFTADFYAGQDPGLELREVGGGPGRLFLLDPVDYICPDGNCPLTIGGVYVYLDAWHLSASYAATLAVPLDRQLVDQGIDQDD